MPLTPATELASIRTMGRPGAGCCPCRARPSRPRPPALLGWPRADLLWFAACRWRRPGCGRPQCRHAAQTRGVWAGLLVMPACGRRFHGGGPWGTTEPVWRRWRREASAPAPRLDEVTRQSRGAAFDRSMRGPGSNSTRAAGAERGRLRMASRPWRRRLPDAVNGGGSLEDPRRLTCSMVDASVKTSVNRRAVGAVLPGGPQTSRSQHIPILLGAPVDAPNTSSAPTARTCVLARQYATAC